MIVERVAYGMARGIKKANPEQTAKKSVLYFGLKIIVNAAAILTLTFIVSLIFHNTYQTILAAFGFALLRFFSGGFHIKSSDRCVLVSASILILLPLLDFKNMILIYNIFSLLLIAIFAPSGVSINIKMNSINNQILLKIISIILVLLNIFILKSDILSTAFFVQSLTLIKYGSVRVK